MKKILIIASDNSIIKKPDINKAIRARFKNAVVKNHTIHGEDPYYFTFQEDNKYLIILTEIVSPDEEKKFEMRIDLLTNLINNFKNENMDDDIHILIHASAISRDNDGYFPALDVIPNINATKETTTVYSSHVIKKKITNEFNFINNHNKVEEIIKIISDFLNK